MRNQEVSQLKIIGMFDGGSETIKYKGHKIEVGVIRCRIQQNEETPFEINGYYNKFFRKNVMNGLKHLHFLQDDKKPAPSDEAPAIPDNNGNVDG